MKQPINLEPVKKPGDCSHENFACYADVNRITQREGGDPVCFTLDLKIFCRECGQPLEFVGLPLGFSFYQPTVSIDGQEARIPMVIPGKEVPAGMLGFGVTMKHLDAAEVVKQ